MSATLARPTVRPEQPQRRTPTRIERFGYVIAAAINGGLIWVAHRLLDWRWPGFLTDDFELVLGLVTASLIASIVINLALAVHHRGRFRVFSDIVTAAFGLAVGVRMWEVFPFDFAGYVTDWSGLVRVALGIGVAATGIAIIANLAKLVTRSAQDDESHDGDDVGPRRNSSA